jgi:hypothetical protein
MYIPQKQIENLWKLIIPGKDHEGITNCDIQAEKQQPVTICDLRGIVCKKSHKFFEVPNWHLK